MKIKDLAEFGQSVCSRKMHNLITSSILLALQVKLMDVDRIHRSKSLIVTIGVAKIAFSIFNISHDIGPNKEKT